MKELINENTNKLTGFKANVSVTKADVKAASIAAAAAIRGNAAPEITTNEDAQEEANRQNVFRPTSSFNFTDNLGSLRARRRPDRG